MFLLFFKSKIYHGLLNHAINNQHQQTIHKDSLSTRTTHHHRAKQPLTTKHHANHQQRSSTTQKNLATSQNHQSIHNHRLPPRKISQLSTTTHCFHKSIFNVPVLPRKILQHPTTTHYYHQTIHNGPIPLVLFRCNFNRCELLCNFIIT